MRSVPLPLLALPSLALALTAIPAEAARPAAEVVAVKGEVTGRPPKSETYGRLEVGNRVPYGSRVRTGADGAATLTFADGTRIEVRPKTEVLVRPRAKEEASGVTLFFGRVWSKVVKSVSGEETFEVESANAVAGVRGTQFEVGVADDGSTRVIVTEGKVAVGGDTEDGVVPISAGFEIESDGRGQLAKRRRADKRPNWDGWFAKRARILEKRGLKVAKHLNQRLDRRRAKVEKLVAEQRSLRQQIERLEARRGAGADVEAELKEKLARLQKVTARLEDMKDRLQAAFGMFERWGQLAEDGSVEQSEQLGLLAQDVRRVAAQFADMIEEGTDLSEDGMDEMMDDMRKGGGTLRPK